MGGPSRRRPRELRDAALVRGGHRALRAAVRGRARGRRARPASRVPVDQVRAGARGRRADRRPAPPRPPGGLPRRARRDRPGGRRDLRRHGLRRATAPSGAASCCSATWRASSASALLLAGADAGRRGGRSGEPWRMACSWLAAAFDDDAAAAASACCGGSSRRLGARCRSWPAPASRRRSRPASGGCSTRSRRCAACAPRSTTRARPPSSWRPLCDPGEQACL